MGRISKRTVRLLRRRGYLSEEADLVARPDADVLFQDTDAMATALGASVQSKIAFGPRTGLYVRRIGKGFGYDEEAPLAKGTKCAQINCFNLQAATYVAALDRRRLEELVGYMARPPLATDRLSMNDDGDLIYKMKRSFSDGTHAILLSPLEMIEKLCAMIPLSRAHQVIYTGVFSSHSKWRNLIVLNPKARKGFNPEFLDKEKAKNHKWPKLLMRIFKIDVGTCPKCGTDMEIRAAIRDPGSIRRYLRCIGLAEHSPPIAPARYEQRQLKLSFDEVQSSPPDD